MPVGEDCAVLIFWDNVLCTSNFNTSLNCGWSDVWLPVAKLEKLEELKCTFCISYIG